jgi:hypothetical protein
LILRRAIYQILHRGPGYSWNIHVKPATVLHVWCSREEHCPESQT